jgi:uncharacterized protein (TIGR02996 family)
MALYIEFLEEYTDEMHAFVLAICANVGDQLQQLIFADWLEEHGHNMLAEAMRHHDLLARLVPSKRGYNPDCSPVLPHECEPSSLLFGLYRVVNMLHGNDPGDVEIRFISWFHHRLREL